MTQSNTTALTTALNYISDSREGYTKAAETVERTAFKRIFTARAQERANMAARIETTLRARGEEVEQEKGTAMGAMHRSLMSFAALVASDEKAAIETLDDGDERLLEKIRDIIENGDLYLKTLGGKVNINNAFAVEKVQKLTRHETTIGLVDFRQIQMCFEAG